MTKILALAALGLALIHHPVTAGVTADEDRLWIEQYLKAHPQPATEEQPLFGRPVRFSELGAHLGKTIHVLLANGQHRKGVLQRLEGAVALIRVPMTSGHFDFRLSPGQAKRLEVE